MAFSALTTAQVDADSPLDSTLFGTIKANFDDLDSRLGTMEGGGITQDMLAYAVGDVLFLWSDANSTELTTSTLTVLKEARISRSGTLRIKFTLVHGWTSGSLQITAQIYRVRAGNGSAVGTLRTMVGTDADTEFSEDISGWAPGDYIQIKCTAYNTEHSAIVKNFRLYSGHYILAETITVA